MKGNIIRSKARWIEDGEKCTKYFMQLEKRNSKQKYIKTLHVENRIINNPVDILKEEKIYYEKLYQNNQTAECENCCLFRTDRNQLNNLEKIACDNQITIEELTESIRNLKNNKSPGSDGLTAEFYKFFWTDLSTLLFNSYNYSFENEQLSAEQRQGILNLLPKPNKDIRLLKNWRPISLLNIDYKILTKLFATRLQRVIQNIVSAQNIFEHLSNNSIL